MQTGVRSIEFQDEKKKKYIHTGTSSSLGLEVTQTPIF